MSITYKQLSRKHVTYNADYWNELRILANGGSDLDEKWVRHIMPQTPGEEDEVYNYRVKNFYHIPYLGQMIGFYISSLSNDPVTMDTTDAAEMPEYYQELEKSVYRGGPIKVDLNRHLLEAASTSCIAKTSWALVDFPKTAPDELPRNKLEEEIRGTNKAYICPVDPCEVYNWREDDDCQLMWVVIHNSYMLQEDITDDAMMCVEEFTCWYPDRWERYTYKYTPDKAPKDSDTPTEEDTGTHTFGRVPVLRLTMPDELVFGNKLGSLCKKITQKANALDYGSDRSLFQFLVFTLKEPDIDTVDGKAEDTDRATNQTIGPGRGWIGAQGDKVEYVSPDSGPFKFAQEHIQWLHEQGISIMNQAALSLSSTSPAAAKRSADSKKLDMVGMETVLKHMGVVLKDYAEQAFAMVAAGRKENVEFTARGAEDFNMFSVDDLIQQATQMATTPAMASPTFKAKYYYELIKANMIGHPEEDLEEMYEELVAAFQLQAQSQSVQTTAAMKQLGDGTDGGSKTPIDGTEKVTADNIKVKQNTRQVPSYDEMP